MTFPPFAAFFIRPARPASCHACRPAASGFGRQSHASCEESLGCLLSRQLPFCCGFHEELMRCRQTIAAVRRCMAFFALLTFQLVSGGRVHPVPRPDSAGAEIGGSIAAGRQTGPLSSAPARGSLSRSAVGGRWSSHETTNGEAGEHVGRVYWCINQRYRQWRNVSTANASHPRQVLLGSGKFRCPQVNQHPDMTHCCGRIGAQHCCTQMNTQAHIGLEEQRVDTCFASVEPEVMRPARSAELDNSFFCNCHHKIGLYQKSIANDPAKIRAEFPRGT
ncbi:unnamed protein product [Protopolystoma xenopodis]|uniref:Uncharacterized protein n=1 Tax=Protopolystoma xenopodis TaxID=117903 RepID=A0A3S4ZMB0_9PLAT|nr:unnamed protein product [Protopolystoma xenopodis]